MSHDRVLVLGAGCIGMTTAIALLEQKVAKHVLVVADAFSPDLTTDQSGALWRPVFLGDAEGEAEKVQRWGEICFRRYADEHKQFGEQRTGITFANGYDLFRSEPTSLPDWRTTVLNFKVCTESELKPAWKAAGITHAHSYRSIVAEPVSYMRHLHMLFQQLGGECLKINRVHNVSEVAELVRTHRCSAVVNCTGLGARDVVGDKSVIPVRGQTVKIHIPQLPSERIDHFVICPDDDFLAYIFPRQTDVLLGGTHVDHDNRTEVCDTDTRGIIDRCAQLMPSLKNAQVKWISSGLRPGRPSVRVEVELGALHVPLVHNYGHGGAGMTLHWGCAQDVADMLRNHKQSRL